MRLMEWRRSLGWVAALAVALPLSGCAAMFSGYDLTPSGLTRDEDAFRRAIAFEASKAYQSVIDGRRSLPDDDLLRLLYGGIAGRYAGAFQESSRLLDVASYLAEDRVTLSLSREALSLVTSDRALAYVPGATERLMIPYIAALNHLDAGDLDGAAVEARRLEAFLDQVYDGTPPTDRPADARFLHYLAGAIFEAAGDWAAADVAYRRAGGLPGTPLMPWDREAARIDATRHDQVDTVATGDVIVLVERGFVPHRVEQSVVIVLPPAQISMLTEGSAGEKALAATEAAARILLTASAQSAQYGRPGDFYRDRRYRSGLHLEPWEDDDEESKGNPYLLRISWPVLYQEPPTAAPVGVRAGDARAVEVARLDVGAGVRRDFDDQRTTMLARTVARAASKVVVSAAVEESLGKRDEELGRVAGFLTNLGTLATERADTRAWHLLPDEVAMMRINLPAGTHHLTLDRSDGDGAGTDLGAVTVRPGRTTFVSTRLWR